MPASPPLLVPPTGQRLSRRALGITAACAIAAPTAGALGLAHYEAQIASGLSRRAGLPCTLGAVEAGLTGELALRDVRVGELFWAERVEVALAPSSVLGGPLTLDEVVVAAPRLAITVDADGSSDLARVLLRLSSGAPASAEPGPRGRGRRVPIPRRIVVREGELAVTVAGVGSLRARDVELLPRAGGVRAVARELRIQGQWALPCRGRAPCPKAALSLTLARGAADLDLPTMRARRALAVGGAGQLAVGERVVPLLAASAGRLAPGAPLTAKLTLDDHGAPRELSLYARSRPLPAFGLRGETLPLWPLAELTAGQVALDDATFSGELAVSKGAAWGLAAVGALRGATISHELIAPRPVPVDAEVDLVASLRRGGAATDVTIAGSWTTGAATAAGTIELHRGATVSAEVDLALSEAPCQALLTSLPAAIAAPLEGMTLRGALGGRLSVAVDTAAPLGEGTAIAIEHTGACHAVTEPVWADVTKLLGTAEHAFPDGSRARVGPDAETWAPLRSLPAYVHGAFVAAEDARFAAHDGFDLSQIARSLEIDLREGRLARGGSTISQQLVKNELLDGRRNLARKLVEAILTWRLEERLDKRQILERYLNVIELGPRIWGLEAAAQYWFGISAAKLSVRQAAFLAALTPEPTTMSRRIRAARGLDRASAARLDTVLRAMKRHGLIDADQHEAARQAELRLRDGALRDDPATR